MIRKNTAIRIKQFRNRRGIKCPLCNPINSFSSLEIEMIIFLNN